MTLKNVQTPHSESGSFRDLACPIGFIDRHTFLTKGGDVGTVVALHPRDSECRDAESIAATTARIKQALLSFDERFVVTQYLTKKAGPPITSALSGNPVVDAAIQSRDAYLRSKASTLFSYDTKLSIVCKPNWRLRRAAQRLSDFLKSPLKTFKTSFTANGRILQDDATIDAANRHLHRATSSFLDQTADLISGRVLGKSEQFRFFRRLFNPSWMKADALGLISDAHLDFFLPDSVLECYSDHLRLDEYCLKVLTLKEPPSHTRADLLRALLRVSGDMTIVLEWQFMDTARATSLTHAKRRHFHQTKSSMWHSVGSERPMEREVLFDEAKEALVSDLGRCREEMELKGLRLGELSLSILLYGKSIEAVEQSTSEVLKVFGMFEGALNEERYNALNAYLATLPGGYPFNLRKLIGTNQNHADLSLWFLPSEGDKGDAFLGQDPLISFETEDRSLFGYSLHVQDVGHTVVVGPTGTGKSFLLSGLNIHAQKYQPITMIFDVGGGFSSLIQLLGGSHVKVRPDSLPFECNPLRLDPTPENLHFLHSLFKLLIESSGYVMTGADGKELFDAIRWVYVLDPEQRRLLTLATTLGAVLGDHLRPWVEGGQYARWFDNADDTVSFKDLQGFDFEGMERLPVVLERLLYYLLFRADTFIYDQSLATTFKLFALDEAWRFFKHPVTLAYITDALRTWRKKNAAMILATQSVEDLSTSKELRSVIDNCPTKILLANPTLNGPAYAETFGLSETEQESVRRLIPKKQFLLKRDDFSKVLNFNVDPKSYWLFTTNPYEAEKRRRAVAEMGSITDALEYLAGGKE